MQTIAHLIGNWCAIIRSPINFYTTSLVKPPPKLLRFVNVTAARLSYQSKVSQTKFYSSDKNVKNPVC